MRLVHNTPPAKHNIGDILSLALRMSYFDAGGDKTASVTVMKQGTCECNAGLGWAGVMLQVLPV